MKKNRIRLTESQLHKVIKESVKRVLREDEGYFYDMVMDVIEEELLDMEDEFSKEEIGDMIVNILKNGLRLNYDFEWGDYQVRVHNSKKDSFVSFSSIADDDRGTGVSERSMSYLIPHNAGEIDSYVISELLSSVNQAWYMCNQEDEEDELEDDEFEDEY